MTQPFNQTKRSYPNLPADTHPDVRQAINDLHDYTYQLRDENQKLRGDLDEHKKAMSNRSKGDNFLGLKLKAVTDQTTLVTGNSFKWNAQTSQFELGP